MIDYNSDVEEEEKKLAQPKRNFEEKFRSHYQVYPAEMIESYLNDDEVEIPTLLDPEAIRKKRVERESDKDRTIANERKEDKESGIKDRFEMSGFDSVTVPEDNRVTILRDECVLESYRSQSQATIEDINDDKEMDLHFGDEEQKNFA